MHWYITIAVFLVLLKQFFKLFINNRPDSVDCVKAVVSLPTDIVFLIVSLLVRQFSRPSVDAADLLVYVLLYVLICAVVTMLWRVTDDAISQRLNSTVGWIFSLNLGLAGGSFCLALFLLK